MKNYTAGRIFCTCSIKMHCKGGSVRIYKNTPRVKACPNCERVCKVVVKVEEQK